MEGDSKTWLSWAASTNMLGAELFTHISNKTLGVDRKYPREMCGML